MRKKQNLVSALGTQNKIGVTMHFSEIIKLQLGKERHTSLCTLKLFANIVDSFSLKNASLLPIFFLNFNNTCLDLLFPHIHKPRKKYL